MLDEVRSDVVCGGDILGGRDIVIGLAERMGYRFRVEVRDDREALEELIRIAIVYSSMGW